MASSAQRLFVLCAVGVLALCSFACVARGAVLGIDFGTDFVKASMVKPGRPFYIVLDEHSKRKYPAIIAFDDNERHFGNGAVSLALRRPDKTFQYAHWLLGKSADSAQAKRFKDSHFPYVITNNERGVASFKFNDTLSFTSEELIAMTLQNVKRLAEADAELKEINDCVITVPAFFTQKERRAMLDAAQLAGFKVLSLLNENTAAALQYAIDRDYSLNSSSIVAFYNQGSSHTTVSLVKFSAYMTGDKKKNKTVGQFEVLDTTWDEFLGGQSYDERVFQKFLTDLNTLLKNKLKDKAPDITTNSKIMAKLRSTARKTKEVLSANAATPAYIESVYQEIDFRSHLSREEFNTLCADLFQASLEPLKRAIESNGLTPEQVEAVVMIGGNTRIPKLQQVLKDYFKRDLSFNLNADEAAAMGAAFHAANISTQFIVRQLGMTDVFTFPIGARFSDIPQAEQAAVAVDDAEATAVADSDSEVASESAETPVASKNKPLSKRASLYKHNNVLNKRKAVSFPYGKDIHVKLHYDSSELLPRDVTTTLGSFNITGVQEIMSNPDLAHLLVNDTLPQITVSFVLSESGVVSIAKAEATLTEMVQVEATATKPSKDSKKKNQTTDSSDAEKSSEKSEDSTKEQDSAKEDAKEKESSDAEASGSSSSAAEKVWKKKTHTFPLKVTEAPPEDLQYMSTVHKNQARAVMHRLTRQDQTKKEIAQAKNNVESFVYDTRNKLSDPDVEAVTISAQREELNTFLDETSEWLSMQSDDSATPFLDRMSELRKLAEPIFHRAAEAKRRPQAINATMTVLNYSRNALEMMRKERPWIKNTSLDDLAKLLTSTEEWVNGKLAEQNQKLTHEEPAFTADELHARVKALASKAADLLKIKKPKPKTPKNKTNSTASSNTTSASSDAPASDDSDQVEVEDDTESGSESTKTKAESESTSDDSTKSPESSETNEASQDAGASKNDQADEHDGHSHPHDDL